MKRMVLGVIFAACAVLSTGCTPHQNAIYRNIMDGYESTHVCFWDLETDHYFEDQNLTAPCNAAPSVHRVNIIMATGQDDDMEWYIDVCAKWGDTEFIVYPAEVRSGRPERWVCENVDK